VLSDVSYSACLNGTLNMRVCITAAAAAAAVAAAAAAARVLCQLVNQDY
jgi:hypothetical protein